MGSQTNCTKHATIVPSSPRPRVPWPLLLSLLWVPTSVGGCDCGGQVQGAPVDASGGDGGGDASDAGDTGQDSGVDGPVVDGQVQRDAPMSADARPAVGKVVINEVVAYPLADWDHTSGPGAPYQGSPGTGAVGASDEYVELLNLGPDTLDLTGWSLVIGGSEPRASVLGEDGVLAVTPGSSLEALRPGDFLIIGNPAGQISTDDYLELRDRDGVLLDDIEIGGLTEARDREGDGVGDGAPAPDRNGFARGRFEEAIARPVGQDDTDDDLADFVAMVATPLAANLMPVPPPESDAPFVLFGPIGAAFPVTDLLKVRFNERLDPFSADPLGVVAVTANGQPIALGFHTFEDDDHTLVVNPIGRLPFDSDIVLTVRGGAAGIKDPVGNSMLGDLAFSVHTEAAPPNPGSVLINEVCSSPVQDWGSDSSGDGVPFSGSPGTGDVTPGDEWIEVLVNVPGPIDVSDYQLVVYNGPTFLGPSREETVFSYSSPVFRVVGSTTRMDSVRMGDRVVIGNPIGVIHASTYIVLRTGTGELLDAVEIGGITLENDRGGDGADNGAPEPGLDGSSTGIADETVARRPDGVDTGDDIADFGYSAATIGQPN